MSKIRNRRSDTGREGEAKRPPGTADACRPRRHTAPTPARGPDGVSFHAAWGEASLRQTGTLIQPPELSLSG